MLTCGLQLLDSFLCLLSMVGLGYSLKSTRSCVSHVPWEGSIFRQPTRGSSFLFYRSSGQGLKLQGGQARTLPAAACAARGNHAEILGIEKGSPACARQDVPAVCNLAVAEVTRMCIRVLAGPHTSSLSSLSELQV
ncbi:hypothetical protein B0H10DRAFT_1959937 [Mycena sp. CBHHK59/15]|nr:hypothetical protein B0H10DRAFT_1959937 [Mycena sp. CBHHK59/15]